MTETAPTAAALAAAQAIHKLINESPSTPTVQTMAIAIDGAIAAHYPPRKVPSAEIAGLLRQASDEIEAMGPHLPADLGTEFETREVRPGVTETWKPPGAVIRDDVAAAFAIDELIAIQYGRCRNDFVVARRDHGAADGPRLKLTDAAKNHFVGFRITQDANGIHIMNISAADFFAKPEMTPEQARTYRGQMLQEWPTIWRSKQWTPEELASLKARRLPALRLNAERRG